jgi:hypothetical protein
VTFGRCRRLGEWGGRARIHASGFLGSRGIGNFEGISTGSPSLDLALGGRGVPRSTARSPRARRHSRCTSLPKRRRRAAWRPSSTPSTPSTRLGQEAGRRHRRAAREPARHGRAGARHRETAGPLQRPRRHRRRLGRGAHAPGRDRGRDGRHPRRPAGPPDEPGDAQAHRRDRQEPTACHLHQPDPREDRRDVRQPRDDPRRPR